MLWQAVRRLQHNTMAVAIRSIGCRALGDGGRTHVTALRAVGDWFVWWIVLVGYYLLLVGKATWGEARAGVVGAAIAATAATVTTQRGELRFQVRLRWAVHLLRLPWRVLADTGIVMAALGRRLVLRRAVHGTFRAVPFDPGSDDPTSAARRALVTAGVSLAPNTYVIAIDRDAGLLLVHQLVRSPEPPGHGDREWPL